MKNPLWHGEEEEVDNDIVKDIVATGTIGTDPRDTVSVLEGDKKKNDGNRVCIYGTTCPFLHF